jgi:DNA-binding beta-propeller fold protein YncE
MRLRYLMIGAAVCAGAWAQLATGPELPLKLVADWAKLPKGTYWGECSGVSVDKSDNVWVFNRGKKPVMKFAPDGRLLDAWEVPVVSSHGIKVDPEGNIWTVDVAAHSIKKYSADGKMLMQIGNPGGSAGTNDSKDAFNRPTGIAFAANGDFYVSDGYVNSRVVKFNKDGEYLLHWGKKGKGDGEFDTVHDVALDGRGRVFVADRENHRVQVFDESGKFLAKWTNLGSPWGFAYNAKEGALYVCDGYANRIVKVNQEGQILGTFGKYGKIPGRLDFAHHMAMDSAGALYVAECRSSRSDRIAAL